jgi:hypothetical protein
LLFQVIGPVLADVALLLLEQRYGCLELLLVERVRIGDPEVRLRLREVQSGIGDVDR